MILFNRFSGKHDLDLILLQKNSVKNHFDTVNVCIKSNGSKLNQPSKFQISFIKAAKVNSEKNE